MTLGLDLKFPSYGTNPQIPVENLTQDWELYEPHGDNHKTIRTGERPFCVCKEKFQSTWKKHNTKTAKKLIFTPDKSVRHCLTKNIKIDLFLSSGPCKFAYLLKCVCNPHVSICGVLLWSFMDREGQRKNLSLHSQRGSNKVTLPAWISPLAVRVALCVCVYLLSVIFFLFIFVFLYEWFCCLKWPTSIRLKCCLLFLSSRRLWRASENTWLLDEIPWVVNCRAFEHEFCVNESTTSIKCGDLIQKYNQTSLSFDKLT